MLTYIPEVDIPNIGPTLIVWLVVGFITGWLAIRIFNGKGIIRYLAGGVAGALLGSYLINVLHIRLPVGPFWAHHIATAFIGAAIVTLIVKVFE